MRPHPPQPGKLTDEEYEIMKTHVSHGVNIIERSSWLLDAGELMASHHEQYTAKGYYRGLKGEGIPLTARIFSRRGVYRQVGVAHKGENY